VDEQLIIVSSDSHAGMPRELWPEYLPRRFHDLLPSLHVDDEDHEPAMPLLHKQAGARSLPERVSEQDPRPMPGKNAIRCFGLDRQRLVDIAKRIGPPIHDVVRGTWDVRPELVESFQQRGGFLKPLEGDAKLPAVATLIDEDLAVVTSGR